MEAYQPYILNYLKEQENKYHKEDLKLKTQKDINSKMRAILIDWIVDITVKFQTNAKTLYMTIDIIDRFISR